VIGLLINGFSGACILIPVLVDFMETIKMDLKMNDSSANDVSSGNIN